MQTAPRGGAERAARPDSFLWGAGHGGAVRPQAERGSLGDGDNGFHLKGRSEPEQRTAGGPAPGQVVAAAAWGPAWEAWAGGGRRGGRPPAGSCGPRGPGRRAAGGVGAKVTGRSRPRSSRRRPKLKAGRRRGFLSASRSLKGRKPFRRGFSLSGPRVGASDLFVPRRKPSRPP